MKFETRQNKSRTIIGREGCKLAGETGKKRKAKSSNSQKGSSFGREGIGTNWEMSRQGDFWVAGNCFCSRRP